MQSPKAELIPAFALVWRKRFGPVARAVAEQQFGIACVAERERRLTELVRRSSANAPQQFPVAIAGKSAIERKLGVDGCIVLWRRKDLAELVGQVRNIPQQLPMGKTAIAIERIRRGR